MRWLPLGLFDDDNRNTRRGDSFSISAAFDTVSNAFFIGRKSPSGSKKKKILDMDCRSAWRRQTAQIATVVMCPCLVISNNQLPCWSFRRKTTFSGLASQVILFRFVVLWLAILFIYFLSLIPFRLIIVLTVADIHFVVVVVVVVVVVPTTVIPVLGHVVGVAIAGAVVHFVVTVVLVPVVVTVTRASSATTLTIVVIALPRTTVHSVLVVLFALVVNTATVLFRADKVKT